MIVPQGMLVFSSSIFRKNFFTVLRAATLYSMYDIAEWQPAIFLPGKCKYSGITFLQWQTRIGMTKSFFVLANRAGRATICLHRGMQQRVRTFLTR